MVKWYAHLNLMLNNHDIIKNYQIDCKCCLQAVFKSITVTAKCNLCVFHFKEHWTKG